MTISYYLAPIDVFPILAVVASIAFPDPFLPFISSKQVLLA
jgi:hypothetical protein